MNIVIYRSRIDIEKYKLYSSPTLEKKLTVYDYKLKQASEVLYLYNTVTNILSIPRGFGVDEIRESLEIDLLFNYTIIDKSKEYIPHRKVKIIMRGDISVKDEHQEKSIEFLTINPEPQKFLNLDVGRGKTFCAIKTASLLSLPSMIIVNTTGLMDQWYNVIKQYTYSLDNDISLIQGREVVKKVMKAPQNEHFYICTVATIAILAKEGILEEFSSIIGVGIKIVDEAHKMYIANNIIDLRTNIRYNYYLTATPNRSAMDENLMYNRITRHIPHFGEYTTQLNKYCHVRNVYINTFPTPWDERRCRIQTGFSNQLYESYLFRNNKRKTYIYLITHYIITKMLSSDPSAKILIILAKNANIEEMSKMLSTYLGISVGKFNSTIKDQEKKKAQLDKYNVIMSTLGSAGVGLDIENLRAIIPFVPFSSPVILHQLKGRLRAIPGKAVFYFNIIDEGFADTIRQANHRINSLRKTANTMSNIELNMEKMLDDLRLGKIKQIEKR